MTSEWKHLLFKIHIPQKVRNTPQMCLLIFLLWEEWDLAVYIEYIEFNSCISYSRKLTLSIDKLFYAKKSEDVFWLNTKHLGFMEMKSNCIYQICLNIFSLLERRLKVLNVYFRNYECFVKKENQEDYSVADITHQPWYKDWLSVKTMDEKHSERRGIFDFRQG